MKLWKAFCELVDIARIVARLVIEEANRANVLSAAPDGFFFALAFPLDANIRYDRQGSHEKHHGHAKRQHHGIAALVRARTMHSCLTARLRHRFFARDSSSGIRLIARPGCACGRLHHRDVRVPATRDFFHICGIVTDMNQPIVIEERVALCYDKNVVAILEESETSARRRGANCVPKELARHLNRRNWWWERRTYD